MPYLLEPFCWVVVWEAFYVDVVVESLYDGLVGFALVGGSREVAYMFFGGGYACAYWFGCRGCRFGW